MTTTTRTAALGVFAATLAAVLAFGITPRSGMAHSNHQVSLSVGLIGARYDAGTDRTYPFVCISGSESRDSAHIDPTHWHGSRVEVRNAEGRRVNYRSLNSGPVALGGMHWQTTYTLQAMHWRSSAEGYVDVGSPVTVNTGAKPDGVETNPSRFCRTGTPTPTPPTPTTPTPPPGHTHPASAHSHSSYAATSHTHATRPHSHSDLKHAHPYATTEHTHAAQEHTHDEAPEHTHTYAAADHTHEAPATPDPETPDPETPAPATPAPGSQSCTYKHRIIGVPGTTGAGFTSQILIGSEDATATVKLSAYQHDNGHAIDVLDSEGSAVGASTSLAPANSVKVFKLEGARGWHTVIVEHPTKTAMNAATVAMRLREPDSGVSVEHVPGIVHCTTASTTTGTPPTAAPPPATETPAPDLVMRDPQALLWPQTFDWRASVVNIGDANAAPTTVRVYRGASVLDTKAIPVVLAPGASWPMSDYISRDRPSVGDVVRICVAPVPGEAVPDHANNCASATVERN